MNLMFLIFQQMVVMLMYLLIGFFMYRKGCITLAGCKDMANMLVKLIIPAVIINSFCIPFSVDSLLALGQSTIAAVILLLLAVLVARWLYPHSSLENFSSAFSNAGFIGIPLVSAVLGREAVLYAVPFVALLNLLQWTYGVDIIKEEQSQFSLHQMLWNPPMVGIGIGFLLFLTGYGAVLPNSVTSMLQGICGLNAPLAMMILGVYLAREDVAKLFVDRKLFMVCGVRLLIIPLLSVLILWLLPLPRTMSIVLLLCAASPVGANVAVYAQLHEKNYAYASKMVVLSTLLSMISLPLVVAVGQLIM